VRGGRHRLAQRHAGRGAHVVLDRLVESTRPGEADRRVGGSRVVQRERGQHVFHPRAQRPSQQRGARERRQQQRDAEVRVGGGHAARRAHRGEHGVADAPLRGPPELRPQRDRAAQHVLVGGVGEVVAGRDVARLLGAGLEHAGELRGAGDRVRGPAGSRRGVRAASPRLLDLHSRHGIACAVRHKTGAQAVVCGRDGESTTTEKSHGEFRDGG
jgi:hypothetical protein